jgi:hexosaminidase
MRTTFLLAVLLGSAAGFAGPVPTPALVPLPLTVATQAGTFRLTPGTAIITDSPGRETGELLHAKLRTATGYPIKVQRETSARSTRKGDILLTTREAKTALGPEGYDLSVTPECVVIRAPRPAGLFYGMQTLLQLLPPEIFATNCAAGVDWVAPCVRVEDSPRFPWRGMMLDVSRHFQKKEFIKRYLDLMAMHKLNMFHWHLVDDQGWRLEIKKYPRLTAVGAWRKQPGYPENDGLYGGFYTQDEVREVVAYAAERHITIVPEIELPGHSQAALAAYPEFACTNQPGFVAFFNEFPAAPATTWPSNSCNVFCASNPKTLEFFKHVLTETMALFPGEYIHIGGDEVEAKYWRQCPGCLARMKAEGMTNFHYLQAALTRQVEQFLNQHQRRLIGWDEILQGDLAPNATVMSWRGTNGGVAAVRAGHPAVMAPNQFLYFNRAQSAGTNHPPAPPRQPITLRAVYAYEPVPGGLTPAQESLILGAEACLWTERVHKPEWLETLSFPRLCALAEVDWSSKAARDWEGFAGRMDAHRRRLELSGVVCGPPN